MPKREDETYRNIYPHPASCTCWKCTQKRLQTSRGSSLTTICPLCHEKSLFYNRNSKKYECLNLRCKATGRTPTEVRHSRYMTPRETTRAASLAAERQTTPKTFIADNIPSSKKNKWLAKRKIPNWFMTLLLIFSLAIVGLGVSILVGNTIPFWLLLGFSSIFAIEKWHSYQTQKHKAAGKFYRLLLNLGILSLFGFIIWSGIKLFSQQYNPLNGSLIFLMEFVCFIWMWRVVARNSWRWPSMKLTISSLICLFLVFSFAGVQPMASYKDKMFSFAGSIFSNPSESVVEQPNSTLITPTPPKPNPPVVVTQPSLKDPSWNQLLDFLLADDTDSHPYVYPTFVCEDFAGMLQSHAKSAGWRCAIITVQLSGYPDWFHYGIPSNTGHACNAFNTTDRGLVYIDDTRSAGAGPVNQDNTVDIQVGKEYIPMALFPSPGWYSASLSMGVVVGISKPQW